MGEPLEVIIEMFGISSVITRPVVRVGLGAAVASLLALGGTATALAASQSTATAPGHHHAHCAHSKRPGRCQDGRTDHRAEARALLEADARTLGITAQELAKDFRQGKTLDELATGKGLSEDQFKAALLPNLKATLADAVAAHRLTQDEATDFYNRVASQNGVPGWNSHRGQRGSGGGRRAATAA